VNDSTGEDAMSLFPVRCVDRSVADAIEPLGSKPKFSSSKFDQ